MDERQLIYDWNSAPAANGRFDWASARVDLNDETLRDGLQSPSVTDPSLDVKKRLLHLMADLGIVAADIGLPGAGPRVVDQVRALATEIRDHRLPIMPNCAARTVVADVEPIVRVADEVGIKIEAATRSEEHTSELQSQSNLVCRLLLEKKKPETAATAECKAHDAVMPLLDSTQHAPIAELFFFS